jgi:hypothetical protein
MPTIIFSPSAQLQQIDDFPADCQRSVKGAIYVAPGRTCVVSDCEAAFLKKRAVAFSVVGAPLKPPTPPAPEHKPPTPAPTPSGTLPTLPGGPLGGLSTSGEPE